MFEGCAQQSHPKPHNKSSDAQIKQCDADMNRKILKYPLVFCAFLLIKAFHTVPSRHKLVGKRQTVFDCLLPTKCWRKQATKTLV